MRPLRLILICVLLGAVTTVGVAWGLVAWAPLPRASQSVIGAAQLGGSHWYELRRTWYMQHAHASFHDEWEAQHDEVIARPRWVVDPTDPEWGLVTQVYGFPCPSMRGFAETAYDWTNQKNIYQGSKSARVLRRRTGDESITRLLPLRPLPLGFTIDTVFYGSIWFGLIMCPGVVRRKLRQRRGLCPSCAYDMQGSSGTCPECGNVIEPDVD